MPLSILGMSGAFGEDVQSLLGFGNQEQAFNQPREQAGVQRDLNTALPFLQQAPQTFGNLQANRQSLSSSDLQQTAEDAYRQILQGPVYSRAFNAPFGNPMPNLGDLTTPAQLQSHLSLAYARDALERQGLPATNTINAPGISGMSLAQFLQGFKGTAGLGSRQFVPDTEFSPELGPEYVSTKNALPGQTLPEAYKILLGLNPNLAATDFGRAYQSLVGLP